MQAANENSVNKGETLTRSRTGDVMRGEKLENFWRIVVMYTIAAATQMAHYIDQRSILSQNGLDQAVRAWEIGVNSQVGHPTKRNVKEMWYKVVHEVLSNRVVNISNSESVRIVCENTFTLSTNATLGLT